MNVVYPGKEGIFKLTHDCWDSGQLNNQNELCGQIRLTSLQENSAIYQISLLQSRAGYIGLQLHTNVDFKPFFSAQEIHADNPMENCFRINDSSQIKRAFQIITEHNQFDQAILEKMQSIVDRGFSQLPNEFIYTFNYLRSL